MPAIVRHTPAPADQPLSLNNIILFNTFTTMGVFSIAAVLGPALFSSRVKRPAVWFNVLITWLLYSISYLLLLGRQFGPNVPPLGLCVFQAALVYATTPLCAVATTCLSVHFFLTLNLAQIKGRPVGRKTKNLLIFLPWMIGTVVAAEAIISIQDSSMVERDVNNFYCHVTNSVPTHTSIVIVFLCGLVAMPLGIWTAIQLRRHWAAFQRLSRTKAHVALSTFLRLTLFITIVSFAMSVSIFTATAKEDFRAGLSILLTTLPIFSALCLGAQRDIANVWFFWRNTATSPPLSPTQPSKKTKTPRITLAIPSPVLKLWKSSPVV